MWLITQNKSNFIFSYTKHWTVKINLAYYMLLKHYWDNQSCAIDFENRNVKFENLVNSLVFDIKISNENY